MMSDTDINFDDLVEIKKEDFESRQRNTEDYLDVALDLWKTGEDEGA